MIHCFKDKSSVMLVKGYVFNDTVKARQCADCKCVSEVLVSNFSNPNLMLYGCRDTKCRNRLLRLSFDPFTPESVKSFKPVEN